MTDPRVATCFWFDTEAEEAASFYVSLLPGSRILSVTRQAGGGKDAPAFLVDYELLGQRYTAMNGGPTFRLSEAASMQVFVETQAEVDRLWQALAADGGTPSRCGWITDRFGLSWQIIPNALVRLAGEGGAVAERTIQAMLGMGKLDIAALEAAGRG